MPVIPRHMSKSAKTHVMSFIEPALGAGVDKNGAPVFVAPLDILIEDIIMVPLGDPTIALGEESEWTFTTRPVPGGPSEDIQDIDFNEPATAVITSLETTPSAAEITVRATQSPRVFAGTAGNGLRIVFVADDINDAAGDIAYDDTTGVIEITIDTNAGAGNGVITAAAVDTLLEGLTIAAATDHLDVTVDNAGGGFTVADDVGVTEGVLTGGQDEFPNDGEVYDVLPDVLDENRLLPRGGLLEIAIVNDGAATPATLVQIVYSIAQEL